MSDDIDTTCERIEAADEKAAAAILLALTGFRQHEVMKRIYERGHAPREVLARLELTFDDIEG